MTLRFFARLTRYLLIEALFGFVFYIIYFYVLGLNSAVIFTALLFGSIVASIMSKRKYRSYWRQ